MKKKSKKVVAKKKNEFRYHAVEIIKRNGRKTIINHPTYIFVEKGDIYVYIQITHSEKVKGLILIKLNQNPNPKDNKESYMVAEIKEDLKTSFSRIKKDWAMNEDDIKKIWELYKKR